MESHTKLSYFGPLTEMWKNVTWVLLSDIFRAYQQAAVGQYKVMSVYSVNGISVSLIDISLTLHGWSDSKIKCLCVYLE